MRTIVLWLAIAAAVPVPLRAQLTIEAYADTLAGIDDPAVLRRMGAALPVTGAGADAEAALRRGLIDLRIHELTGDDEDVRHARDVFDRAAERFPGDARVHHGLALANLASPGARIASPRGALDGVTVAASIEEILKRDPRSRARRALEAALRADPSYGAAAALLADLAVRDGRDRKALEEARDALRAARAAGSMAPEVARALSDVERALGNYAVAADEAGRSPDDGKLAAATLHARAIALFMQPGREAEAAAAYDRGAERLTASAAERYYEDVAPIVTAAEAAEWRAVALGAKRVWLDRFWGRRAAESGVTPAERMAEHYRRLAVARERYLRNSTRGVDGDGVLLADAAVRGGPYDDRGIILLKHGPPAEVVRSAGRGLQPNETWVYGREDGNLLFHFVALRGARDFTLTGDLFEALDTTLPLRGPEHTRAVLGLIADVGAYHPGYASAANRLRRPLEMGEPLDGTEIRSITERAFAEYRRDARRALERDTYLPRYARAIAFHYDLFTLRSAEGRTELTAAFAVPRAALTETSGGFLARISVILLDTLTGTTARRDTIALLRASSERNGDAYLRTHFAFTVDPSETIVHRVVVRDTAGAAGTVLRGTSDLRSYAGGDLRISDVVLAEPDPAGQWERGGARMTLSLPRAFRPERPFTVYYEVYGLADGAAYRTEVRVEPVDGRGVLDRVRGLFGRGPGAVDLRFEDVAAPRDGTVAETRRLGTDLPPGDYRLTITVTDRATGVSATTGIRFEVIE